MQPREATLPAEYEPRLRAALERRGYKLEDSKKLADCVMRLSDFYLQNPSSPTPWTETWAQVASIVYYFPLNYSRNNLVARELKRLGFFKDLTNLVDDGAGMGSGIHAFNDHEKMAAVARDISPDALRLLRELKEEPTELVQGTVRKVKNNTMTLLLASYVFTELKDIPLEWFSYEALVIVEPSTRDDARRLQEQRPKLIENGFTLWAPCTHQGDCPLLQFKNDWCHDRVHFDAPEWFSQIEKHLPMKNKTLSFSYLAARKKPFAIKEARLVSDTQDEKGKSRQAICRGPEKEFLAWFPQRMKADIEMSRGNLVRIDQELERKSDERRLKSPRDIRELPIEETPSQTQV